MVVTWGVFITDYVVHVRLLRGYARSRLGMFDLGVVVLTAPWFLIPGLGGSQFVALARLARLARIAKVSDGGFRRLLQQLGRVGLYTVLLVVACAYVAYEVEHPVNDQFADFGDSVFWAIVTITTVGYGDIVPITTVGRVMSVILMFSGVALLGVLAGTLASFFGFGDNDDDDGDAATTMLPSRRPVFLQMLLGRCPTTLRSSRSRSPVHPSRHPRCQIRSTSPPCAHAWPISTTPSLRCAPNCSDSRHSVTGGSAGFDHVP